MYFSLVQTTDVSALQDGGVSFARFVTRVHQYRVSTRAPVLIEALITSVSMSAVSQPGHLF